MSEPEDDYNWNHIAAKETDFTSSFANDFDGDVMMPDELLEEIAKSRENNVTSSPATNHVGVSGDVPSCDADSYVHKTYRRNLPQLSDELTYLKGVGPQRAELLFKLGIRRAADLLFYFPRDYVDLTDRRSVEELAEGEIQTVQGVIDSVERKQTRRGTMLAMGMVCEGGGYIRAFWFNQLYLVEQMASGRRLLLTGKPKWDQNNYWAFMHPKLTYLADDEAPDQALEPMLPVYPLTEGLQQHHLRKILRNALPPYVPLLDEVFPESFLQQHNLPPIHDAVRQIHFPKSGQEAAVARRRFIFQELFILQASLAIRRLQHQTRLKAPVLEISPKIDTRIRKLFPFALTESQENVIREIAADMRQPIPMNRLLQGDVGSGKTVIAVYAMLLAAAHDYQAVFMAPTEVLARQHLRTLRRMLEQSRVKIAELFGGQKSSERAQTLAEIASGDAKIIVGTQAIIANEIDFHQLGVVVIDEQHKFGVRQRAQLKIGANFDPHYLVMTATPIPRSVTMTLFGDLDVSMMNQLPPGRQKISTYLAMPEQRGQWWEFVRKKLRDGRQAYVVVPLVEESEQFDAHNIQQTTQTLKSGELKDFSLEMLHGRMSNDEKERIMYNFRTGETQVLVATSVIEVGVDVPNATLMTIENGERFGLAQLHQLRGRIGRGSYPSFCAVFSEQAYQPQHEDSLKRLKAFAETTDGFKLAETDFELRGPGELFGTQQHGLPPFHIADLARDKTILLEVRQIATELVRNDPGLSLPEHAKIRKQILNRYGKSLELGDVG
ncbi:MAG: ATP-dependent DNA helicase RecG [Planctomycetaceae bacterium]|jgi:ATP-dependent DNA helicase RecG|nr:ATP-dependent DNA helicase RecG [Planctomycetaceae bacterium]